MDGLLKYFLSGTFIFLLFYSCDKLPLEYRLSYNYTKTEQDSLRRRIEREIRFTYEGSALREAKMDTLAAIDSEREDYDRRKALSLARMGDYHLAFPLIEKAIQKDPLNALYFVGWEMLYLYRDYERAMEYFTYYDDISPGVDYVWGENIHYLKGLAYKQMRLYDQAVEEFDKCIIHEGRRTDTYVYVYRGIANLRNECLEDAIMDFDKALRIDEKCTMALLYKGETYINMNDLDLAKQFLTEAKELLKRGIKKTHPYVEVFDEVHLYQVDDLFNIIQSYIS